MRRALMLFPLAAVLFGADEATGVFAPPTLPRAKSLRDEGARIWSEVEPLWKELRARKPVDGAAAAAALPKIEEAASLFHRSVAAEWSSDANLLLAEAVRAWHGLRAVAPPPEPPQDPRGRERLERLRKDRIADARRLVVEWGAARRHDSQFLRCDRCDGRRELTNAYGDARFDCPKCRGAGSFLNTKTILGARWLTKSPLLRADGRAAHDLDLLLKTAGNYPKRLAPFLKSLVIEGEAEDHDVWVRFRTSEKTVEEPGSARTAKSFNAYVLYRVGRLWFFYDPRYDKELVAVPEEALKAE